MSPQHGPCFPALLQDRYSLTGYLDMVNFTLLGAGDFRIPVNILEFSSGVQWSSLASVSASAGARVKARSCVGVVCKASRKQDQLREKSLFNVLLRKRKRRNYCSKALI